MIFVTVGTHEQPFNRLIKKIDILKKSNVIFDDVIIQKGYSTYEPCSCETYSFLPYDRMLYFLNKARIVITHGGPSSFIYPISIGKMPIVVPRQKKYGEHVNDHQLIFCRQLKSKGFPIHLVENIDDIEKIILSYSTVNLNPILLNNKKFNIELENNIKKIFRVN